MEQVIKKVDHFRERVNSWARFGQQPGGLKVALQEGVDAVGALARKVEELENKIKELDNE